MEVPQSPKPGEVYKHYKKGDLYKVTCLALHSNDEEWMVVYEPQYPDPAAPFFTRPLREWADEVDWEGVRTARFTKVA